MLLYNILQFLILPSKGFEHQEQRKRPDAKNLDIYCYYNDTDDRENSDEVTSEAQGFQALTQSVMFI